MRRPGPRLRFGTLAVVYFILLMSIAPGWFYPPVFRAVANTFFHDFGKGRIARYDRFDDPRGTLDTKISVGSDARGYPVYPSSQGINCVREGYTPTAAMIALFLATPVPWRQRWNTMLLGVAIVQVFVGLRLTIAVLYGFSRLGMGDRHLLEIGAFGSRMLHRADQILTGDLHFTYIAPVLIWLLLASRFVGVRSLWTVGTARDLARRPAC